jgi:hypothetical protein
MELVSVSNPFTSHYYASSIMAQKMFMSSYIFRLFEKNINEILIFQFPILAQFQLLRSHLQHCSYPYNFEM